MVGWRNRLGKRFVTAAFAGSLILAGCGKGGGPDAPKVDGNAANGNNGAGVVENSANVNFNEKFEEAVITEVIDGQHFPPNVTIGGKKTGTLRAAVEELWPKIKLTDPFGGPIAYTATLNTIEGPIEIELRPAIAPNHVRNFLVLTKLGYYDGLRFDRIVHQEAETDGMKSRLDLVIAGCPTGTGDEGFGHIGYFVRAEFQQDLKHAEGTVGFWHEQDDDSAGTRFYITLGPAPAFDGKFTVIGSVTKGLDVVKRIAAAPLQSKDVYPENEKPVAPVAIQNATLAPEIVEK